MISCNKDDSIIANEMTKGDPGMDSPAQIELPERSGSRPETTLAGFMVDRPSEYHCNRTKPNRYEILLMAARVKVF